MPTTNQPNQCPECGGDGNGFRKPGTDEYYDCPTCHGSGLAPAHTENVEVPPTHPKTDPDIAVVDRLMAELNWSRERAELAVFDKPAIQPDLSGNCEHCDAEDGEQCDSDCANYPNMKPAPQPEPTAYNWQLKQALLETLSTYSKSTSQVREVEFVSSMIRLIATEHRAAVEAFAERLKGEAETMYLPADEYGDRESVDGVTLEQIDETLKEAK